VLNDTRVLLQYLQENASVTATIISGIAPLVTRIAKQEEFELVIFSFVYGELNDRGLAAFSHSSMNSNTREFG